VQGLSLWLLVPENKPYDRYRIAETSEPGKSHRVIPSEGMQAATGTILHWSLFQPDVRALYTCSWEQGQE
jgi:hypothetical protein